MVQPKIPRIQSVVLPLLRDHLGPDVKVGSWIEDIDYRLFPLVNIKRFGGTRHMDQPTLMGLPIIEMTAYSAESLIEAENIYETALEGLYEAVRKQTQTPKGYLHSIFETMGSMQFSSQFGDSWRVQGLIRLGLKPPRNPN